MKHWLTGEQVNYQYDALNRLVAAETTGAGWGQAFGYDGFGNLVSQTVTKGSAPSLTVAVNPATNRVVGASYDANGNLLWGGYSYDVENRLLAAPWEEYAYDVNNRRVWKRKQVGEGQYREEVYFYGGGGERLGTYRLVRNGATATFDYWPYGQEKPSATAQEREKFGTYYRDATGLDYADQRCYASHWGRFLTADPFVSATALENPTRGWNRYAYVEGDPVNFWDPSGLCAAVAGTEFCFNVTVYGAAAGVRGWVSSGGPGEPWPLWEVPAFWAGEVGGGGSKSSSREERFQRDAAGARRNWESASSRIRNAVPQDSVFTPQMLDCIAGLEAAWDPSRDGRGGRTGLFQYSEETWTGEYNNLVPWSLENAREINISTGVALGGLNYRLTAVKNKHPDWDLGKQLARAITLFGTGQDAYGAAIMECAKHIDSDFEQAFRAIWNYLNP